MLYERCEKLSIPHKKIQKVGYFLYKLMTSS